MSMPAHFLSAPERALHANPVAVERLSSLFFRRTFAAGETIVSADGPRGFAVIIGSGTAREVDGIEREFGPGELIDVGDLALDGARPLHVVARTRVEARIVTRVGLERLQELHPTEWRVLLPAVVRHISRDAHP
jgi:CRP-like cAMP-binding protein